MKNFDDIICGLQQDIEVPDDVWTKYMNTLSTLPDKQNKQVAGNKRLKKYIAAAAAFAIIGSFGCYANPTLAAKIPIIGKIFVEVQQLSTFSGEYDDKAVVLNTESTNAEEVSNPEYVVENADVKVTASEIYCDGMSVFLTTEIEIAQGGLNNIPTIEATSGNYLYLSGSWKMNEDTEETTLYSELLEGKVIDDHTFLGMMKFNLTQPDLQNGTLNLQLCEIGYDDIEELDAEDISASHKIEGEWNLSLPFTVDTEATKVIEINTENQGYCLNKVCVSPYQVITYTDIPYTEKTITQEDFEKIMKEKTGGSDDFVTDEEYMASMGKTYAECYTMVFNQDGERLAAIDEYHGCSINAVQGIEISKLYIYVFDNFEDWIEIKENGMNSEAATRAVIYEEIDVK